MTKNIAFFLPHFSSGGVEGVVLKVLQGLDRSRFTPFLILQDKRGELLERLPADVTVKALSQPKAPGCIFELARLCRDARIELLIAATNAANLYTLLAAALPGTAVKTLIMEHTPPAMFLKEAKRPGLRRRAMQMLYPRADLTGGPLDQIGHDLRDLMGARAPDFVCAPNPVVTRIAALNPVPDVARNIVSVGRLASEKRFDLLIDAFALAQAKHPDLRLTIHGEGPERARLEERITQHSLHDMVHLPGYAQDMDQVHGAADLFVCTSRREGLGNAIIEAMARGVPVLSVDCPFGPPQLLQQGKAGQLLSDHSAPALAEAICTLSQDQATRHAYRTQALTAVHDFDEEAAINAYQDMFDQALRAA